MKPTMPVPLTQTLSRKERERTNRYASFTLSASSESRLTRMQQFRYICVANVDLYINACKGKPVERRGRKATGLRGYSYTTAVECQRGRQVIQFSGVSGLCTILNVKLSQQFDCQSGFMISSPKKSKPFKRKIIIRRIRRVIRQPPRGAWKIAYADFVTALMAFFLMLWLISAVSVNDRRAIEKYFKTPLLTVLAGGQHEDLASSQIVSDYGDDKTMAAGQVKYGAQPTKNVAISMEDAGRLLRLQEIKRLQSLEGQLEQLIETDPKLSRYKDQLQIDMTTEGLRIMIIDAKNRPMFEIGSAILQPYAVEILRSIGKTLNQVPNKIGLSGHTDALAYQGGNAGYSNWELSSDRANASRRELIAGGMDQSKVLRVVGLAHSMLFNPVDQFDARNRRISIIVMNSKAEASALEKDGQ